VVRLFKILIIPAIFLTKSFSQNIDSNPPILSNGTSVTTDAKNIDLDSHLISISNYVVDSSNVDTLGLSVDTAVIKNMYDSMECALTHDSGTDISDTLTVKKQSKSRRVEESSQYRGTSKELDHLARQVVLDAYQGSWSDVARGLERLQKFEKRHNLVKISKLLNVSVRLFRLEQNEFVNDVEKKATVKELDSCIADGLSYAEKFKNNRLPLHELIYCGIKGFQVSRLIEKNPIEAAVQGYAVIVRIEKLIQTDSTMYDANLGLGIFYCSVASAPQIIRAALALTGRQITLEKGLSYLRIGAQKGHYVDIPSLVYLTQFLSPYLGHHTAEKDSIYLVLQKKCEENPRYLFDQIDEQICFHPEIFTPQYNAEIRKKISGYKNVQPQLRHYYELMKYQYCNYIDTLNCTFKKDTTVNLRGFCFYPLFMESLRYKEMCMVNNIGTLSRFHAKDCEKNIAEIVTLIDRSSIISTKRDYYKWHLHDALKLR
jgi:hypothetical protein